MWEVRRKSRHKRRKSHQAGERRSCHERTWCPGAVLPLLLPTLAIKNRRQVGISSTWTNLHICRGEWGKASCLSVRPSRVAILWKREGEFGSLLYSYIETKQDSLHVHQVCFLCTITHRLSYWTLCSWIDVHQMPATQFCSLMEMLSIWAKWVAFTWAWEQGSTVIYSGELILLSQFIVQSCLTTCVQFVCLPWGNYLKCFIIFIWNFQLWLCWLRYEHREAFREKSLCRCWCCLACLENKIWNFSRKCHSLWPKYWNSSHRRFGISVNKLIFFKIQIDFSASSKCNAFQVRSRCCYIAFSFNVRYACRFSQDAAHLVLRRFSKVCCEHDVEKCVMVWALLAHEELYTINRPWISICFFFPIALTKSRKSHRRCWWFMEQKTKWLISPMVSPFTTSAQKPWNPCGSRYF